ncbi:MAG: hypothetical protein JW995_13980 [Melioribacteraceae bacterium]|nr:hypothetical protein [Melioribacteraceae bacterium]
MTRFYAISVAALIITSACNEQPLLNKETAARIYVDLLVIKEKFYSQKDSIQIYKEKVFDKYGTDSLAYKLTLEKYEVDQDEWKEFFDLSEQYLDTLRTSLND